MAHQPGAFAMLYDVETREPDTQGFAFYRPAPVLHQAIQITEPFTLERVAGGLFTGKADDYVVQTVTLLPKSAKQADFMPHLPLGQQSAIDASWSPPFPSVRFP